MRQAKKDIEKTSKLIDKNVRVFSSMDEEVDKAIDSFDKTIQELEEDVRAANILIREAELEKERAIAFKQSISSFVK